MTRAMVVVLAFVGCLGGCASGVRMRTGVPIVVYVDGGAVEAGEDALAWVGVPGANEEVEVELAHTEHPDKSSERLLHELEQTCLVPEGCWALVTVRTRSGTHGGRVETVATRTDSGLSASPAELIILEPQKYRAWSGMTGVPIVVYVAPGVTAGDDAYVRVSLTEGETGSVDVELTHDEFPNTAGQPLLDVGTQLCTVPPGGSVVVPVHTRASSDGGRVETWGNRTDTEQSSVEAAALSITGN